MFKKILVASSDNDLRDLLVDTIESTASTDAARPNIHEARHAAIAEQKRKQAEPAPFDLVIIHVDLAEDGRSKVAPGGWRGLELLKGWHAAGWQPASILVTGLDSIKLRGESRRLHLCELLCLGQDVQEELSQLMAKLAATMALGAFPAQAANTNTAATASRPWAKVEEKQPTRKVVTIDFVVRPNRSFDYRIQWHQPDRVLPWKPLTGTVEPNWEELDAAIEWAKQNTRLGVGWSLLLRMFGKHLFDQIFAGHFGETYRHSLDFCDGEPRNLRIRFELDRFAYPIAVEALNDGRSPEFLMLDAPIARRVPSQRTTRPLDLDSGRLINVLVIEFDVGENDYPKGPSDQSWKNYWQRVGSLNNLENIAEERTYFEALGRRKDKAQLGLGKITIARAPVKPQKSGWSLWRQVKKLMTKLDAQGSYPRFYIVHFAGHSCFLDMDKDEDDRGFLLFAGEPHPEVVTVATFADYLEKAGTRFVYLSSCNSSTAETAFQMARYAIPAVLGFRWDLDDAKAVEFAKRFYDNLLGIRDDQLTEHLCFAEAFTRARRELYDIHKVQQSIWAAPVLIMQPEDWHLACGPTFQGAQEQVRRAAR